MVYFHTHRTLALRLGFLGILEFLSNSSQSKIYRHTSEGHGRRSRGGGKKSQMMMNPLPPLLTAHYTGLVTLSKRWAHLRPCTKKGLVRLSVPEAPPSVVERTPCIRLEVQRVEAFVGVAGLRVAEA